MEDNINEILATKRAWKNGDKDRRIKEGDREDRKEVAACIRRGREMEERLRPQEEKSEFHAGMLLACLVMAFLMILIFMGTKAHAYNIDNPRPMFRINCLPLSGFTYSEIADAIYKTENSKSHPYGIMKKYKHTDARTACLNTIKNIARQYVKLGEPDDFIVFLGKTYSPPNINPNWVRLVKYFLHKRKV